MKIFKDKIKNFFRGEEITIKDSLDYEDSLISPRFFPKIYNEPTLYYPAILIDGNKKYKTPKKDGPSGYFTHNINKKLEYNYLINQKLENLFIQLKNFINDDKSEKYYVFMSIYDEKERKLLRNNLNDNFFNNFDKNNNYENLKIGKILHILNVLLDLNWRDIKNNVQKFDSSIQKLFATAEKIRNDPMKINNSNALSELDDKIWKLRQKDENWGDNDIENILDMIYRNLRVLKQLLFFKYLYRNIIIEISTSWEDFLRIRDCGESSVPQGPCYNTFKERKRALEDGMDSKSIEDIKPRREQSRISSRIEQNDDGYD